MNQKFPLGQIVATSNALESLAPEDIRYGIQRHQAGNWGEVCDSDRQENDLSLEKGFRLLSVYRASNGKRSWIITEADRSSTTVLMPEAN